MATEVGRPEASQIVLGIRDEAADCEVAAVVAEAAVGRIDAVIEPAGAVLIEGLEARHRTVHDAASGGHTHLAALAALAERADAAQLSECRLPAPHRSDRERKCRRLANPFFPGLCPPTQQPQPRPTSFPKALSQVIDGWLAHRSRTPDGGRHLDRGDPRPEKPA